MASDFARSNALKIQLNFIISSRESSWAVNFLHRSAELEQSFCFYFISAGKSSVVQTRKLNLRKFNEHKQQFFDTTLRQLPSVISSTLLLEHMFVVRSLLSGDKYAKSCDPSSWVNYCLVRCFIPPSSEMLSYFRIMRTSAASAIIKSKCAVMSLIDEPTPSCKQIWMTKFQRHHCKVLLKSLSRLDVN